MTLVEVLVVITIVSILMGVLIPAIGAAREAARRAQCKDNLKNLGLGAMHHEGAHGSFPSGGWGWDWVGDPDRGFVNTQPGGWVYNVLPFVEQKDLWSIGKGIDFAAHPVEKKLALMKQITTPFALLYCASRRAPENHPYTAGEGRINNCDLPKDRLVSKSDYAANCGDQDAVEAKGGPMTLAAADDGSYKWPNTGQSTGVIYVRSRINAAAVPDGVSKTLLIGEKYLERRHYADGQDWGDNEPATAGGDNDTLRTGSPKYSPQPDGTKLRDQGFRFGSAHSQGFHAVFCDCAVHSIGYEIDPKVFANLCNRADGQSTRSDAVQ